MEKLRFKNGVIVDLLPMTLVRYEKTMNFTIKTQLGYLEIEDLLENDINISKIEHLSNSDEVLNTYNDGVKYITLQKVKMDEYTENVYKVTLSIDSILATMKNLQSELQMLKDENKALKEESKTTADALEEVIYMILEG